MALVRFGPAGLEVIKTIRVGSFPAEIEGPHGISVSADGGYWYVSLAHGIPFGSVHKYRTGTDEWLGEVTVGMFPATLTASLTTDLLYVVNFDLHGELKPSSLSIIEPGTMTEIARVQTAIRPHGSRLNRRGDRHYSVSTVEDELIEVDALRFEVSRRLLLAPAFVDSRLEGNIVPTWVTAPTSQSKLYVAGFKSNTILEIDLHSWRIGRTFANTGDGPYNLVVVEPLDLLVATYKDGSSVGFWDLVSGTETARIPTSRRVPHGVVATPDGAYSLVTLEGVGSEPGTVEVYDNRTRQRLGTVDVGKQAGGISYWEPPLAASGPGR